MPSPNRGRPPARVYRPVEPPPGTPPAAPLPPDAVEATGVCCPVCDGPLYLSDRSKLWATLTCPACVAKSARRGQP